MNPLVIDNPALSPDDLDDRSNMTNSDLFVHVLGPLAGIAHGQAPSVLVLGLGESGLAMAQWCYRCGCRVRIADTREQPPKVDQLFAREASSTDIDRNINQSSNQNSEQNDLSSTWFELKSGAFSLDLIDDNIKLIAISPGLSIIDPAIALLIEAAQERAIPVWGEFEFFAQALTALSALPAVTYQPKILAVTGTNGKTTVCKLATHLLKRSGCSVILAGNVSPSLLDCLLRVVDRYQQSNDTNELPATWVIEASSFQLASTTTFRADAAAIINITQDHLDWHGSFESYRSAKLRIFNRDQPSAPTLAILCRDDPASIALQSEDFPCLTVGTDLPMRVGDYGVLQADGIDWLVIASAADNDDENNERSIGQSSKKRIRTKVPLNQREIDGNLQPARYIKLMPADALRIRGAHNINNALTALALARASGQALAGLLHGFRDYYGEPHRMQLIASINGIDFVDDSKATNVGATIAALNSLTPRSSARPKKCWLIAGGDGKQQDFLPLAAELVQSCLGIFLIGQDAETIASIVPANGPKVEKLSSLTHAVNHAICHAKAGDTILLSPACASLDMFKDYRHRAQVFYQAVAEHAAEQGVAI